MTQALDRRGGGTPRASAIETGLGVLKQSGKQRLVRASNAKESLAPRRDGSRVQSGASGGGAPGIAGEEKGEESRLTPMADEAMVSAPSLDKNTSDSFDRPPVRQNWALPEIGSDW